MNILQRLDARLTRYVLEQQTRQPVRSWDPFGDFGTFLAPNGQPWPYGLNTTMPNSKTEEIDGSFGSLVEYAYKSNGVVFACMLARMLLFSEARFQWRRMSNGRPGDLFGDANLAVLEHPEPGKATGDLLARAIQDVDLGGNFFAARRAGPTIKRLRPDWVTIILGSERLPDIGSGDIDAEVVGYAYHPGGKNSGRAPEILMKEEVAHFAPIPDPTASYRGMPWLVPVIREIMGDSAATAHKLQFFENAATPNMVVTLGDGIKNQTEFDLWVDTFEKSHNGYLNAYKTLYLSAGTTAIPVGSTFQQLEFKATQGAGETRIAAAAGVPPVIVGLSEGLAAATYSNYGQARRRFADGTIRPLWRNFAGSMETIVRPPAGASLWYDDRDVSFIREDLKDAADIQSTEAQTMRTLVESGWKPDDVVDAVTSGDLARLRGKHTGNLSVQLQDPTAVAKATSTPKPVGGNP